MGRRIADRVEALLNAGDGILRLEPAWVARDFLPAGRRLGLPEDAYDVGERGAICERWLASTTPADNRVQVPDEGLSAISTDDGRPLLLRDAVRAAPELVLGSAYAAAHPGGLGRLAKIFDYAYRLPFHIHPPQDYADRVGRRSKDEAYHFLPGADPGAHPETFLGVHPHIAAGPREDALLPYLEDWDSDLILRTTQAYLAGARRGVPRAFRRAARTGHRAHPGAAGGLRRAVDVPGAERREDHQQGAAVQGRVGGQDRAREGERSPLGFVDWDRNGDPDLYRHTHLAPVPVDGEPDWGRRDWVFFGNRKFSGQRVTVEPGRTARIVEPGVYSVFAWSGTGTWGGHDLAGGDPGRDELLVAHATATAGVDVVNPGPEPLVAYVLSGPDLHPEAALVVGPDGLG